MKDRALYYSLAIGFGIVALIYFYDDYAPVLGLDKNPVVRQPKVEYNEDGVQSSPSHPSTPPFEAPSQGEMPVVDGNSHIVKENETVFSIAERYDLSVEQLYNQNAGKIKKTSDTDINGNPKYIIKPGTKLNIKSPMQAPPSGAETNKIQSASDFVESLGCTESDSRCPYNDKEMDRHIESMKNMPDKSLAKLTLKELEKIKNTFYYIGLRRDEYNFVTHEVGRRDDVYSISAQYDVPVNEILHYNQPRIRQKKIDGVDQFDSDGKGVFEIVENTEFLYFFQKKQKSSN